MYVLEHNNQVINGPRIWNYHSFEATLEDDLDVIYKLPMKKEDDDSIIIDENTHIYKAQLISPEHNPTFDYLDGPFWTFDTIATGTYIKKSFDIETIKAKLKVILSGIRYNKEISGTKLTVQGTEITIDTSRDVRNIFVQKYLLMQDTDLVEWKFPETWLTLTKSELGQVVAAGASYIQDQFNWELAKIQLIDSAQTYEDLLVIDLEQ